MYRLLFWTAMRVCEDSNITAILYTALDKSIELYEYKIHKRFGTYEFKGTISHDASWNKTINIHTDDPHDNVRAGFVCLVPDMPAAPLTAVKSFTQEQTTESPKTHQRFRAFCVFRDYELHNRGSLNHRRY